MQSIIYIFKYTFDYRCVYIYREREGEMIHTHTYIYIYMHMYREIFKNDYKHTCIERQYREGDKCLIPVHIRTHTHLFICCVYIHIYTSLWDR